MRNDCRRGVRGQGVKTAVFCGAMSEGNGFSPAEREAMKQRAEELRREKGGNKKAKNLEAL